MLTRSRASAVAITRTLSAVAALSALAVCSLARAQPAPDPARAATLAVSQVTWDAPEACPSVEAFTARVRRHLQASTLDASAVALSIRIEPRAASFALRLRVITASGAFDRPPLEDPDCGALVGVAALVAAMAIDPLADLSAGAGPGSPGAETPADAGTRTVVATPRTAGAAPFTIRVAPVDDCEAPPELFESRTPPNCPKRARPPGDDATAGDGAPTRLVVRFGVGMDAGTLPALTPGVSATIGLVRPYWQLEVGGAYLIEQRSVARTEPVVAGGDISLWLAAARACAAADVRGRLSVCALGELGWMRGRGFGYLDPEVGGALWMGAGGSLGYAFPISDFFRIHGGLSVLGGISRPRFLECECGNCDSCPGPLVDRIWQPGAVTVRLVTGFEWVFP